MELPLNKAFFVTFGLLAAMLIPGVLLGMYFNDYPALWLLLYPLVITIVIEFVVLLCLHEKRPKVWFMLVLMNVLTNVPLNIWALHSYPSISTQSTPPQAQPPQGLPQCRA